MAVNKTPKIYGFSAMRITPLLTDEAGAAPTYDTANAIIIPGAVNMQYQEDVQEQEARGDERICEVEFTDDKASVTWETVYFPMVAAQKVNGGAVVDNANDAEYFGPAPDEVGEYFMLEGLSKDKKVKQTLYKARGRIKLGGLTGGEFVNATFQGTAIHTSGNIQGKPRRVSIKQSTTAMSFTGVQQVETATVVGTISTAGNATFTVTAAGMTGSPKAISVAVALNDSAAVVAQKARETLVADTAVTALYTVGGSGAKVVLTRITAAANDATLNIAIANGTCAGLTAAPTSEDTTAGSAG